MKLKMRVATRASQFEKRKQEHIQAGYAIDDEQSVPVNGLRSFTAAGSAPPDEETESFG